MLATSTVCERWFVAAQADTMAVSPLSDSCTAAQARPTVAVAVSQHSKADLQEFNMTHESQQFSVGRKCERVSLLLAFRHLNLDCASATLSPRQCAYPAETLVLAFEREVDEEEN